MLSPFQSRGAGHATRYPCFFWLILNLEDIGNRFLRNICKLQPDYAESHPNHRYNNLKPKPCFNLITISTVQNLRGLSEYGVIREQIIVMGVEGGGSDLISGKYTIPEFIWRNCTKPTSHRSKT
jgi:hypothetical protein